MSKIKNEEEFFNLIKDIYRIRLNSGMLPAQARIFNLDNLQQSELAKDFNQQLEQIINDLFEEGLVDVVNGIDGIVQFSINDSDLI